MKLESYLKLLHLATRPLGLFPHDSNGRQTHWYWITLIHFISLVVANVYEFNVTFGPTRGYFKQRPFHHFFMIVEVAGGILGSYYCNMTRRRGIFKYSELKRLENMLNVSLDYDIKFVLFNIYFIPINLAIKFFVDGLVIDVLTWEVQTSWWVFHFLPDVVIHVGAMYYCAILRVLIKQLEALKKSKCHYARRVVLHSYLLELANSIHRPMRYQIMFGVLEVCASQLVGVMVIHEVISSCQSNGLIKTYCHPFFLCATIYDGVASFTKIYAIIMTISYLKSEAESIVHEHTELICTGSRNGIEGPIVVYLLGNPEFTTDVARFFNPRPALLLNLCSEILVIYLLMVQMDVIKPWVQKLE